MLWVWDLAAWLITHDHHAYRTGYFPWESTQLKLACAPYVCTLLKFCQRVTNCLKILTIMKVTKECFAVSIVVSASVFLLGSLVGISVVAVLASPRLEDLSDRDHYSVGDTRVISIDLTLSFGITLKVYRDASAVNATLYALSMPPYLDGINELKQSLGYLRPGDNYRSAFFYLYPRSKVTISACTPNSEYTIYVIEGSKNFTSWQDGERGISVFDTFPVRAKCDSAYPIYPHTMTITEADDWYFATDQEAATVNLTLQRYEYTVKSSSVLSSCNAGGNHPEHCTLALVDHAIYLLKVGSGPNKSVVDLEANVRRALDVTLVALLLFILAIVLIVSCGIIICSVCCRRFRRNKDKEERDREQLVPPDA